MLFYSVSKPFAMYTMTKNQPIILTISLLRRPASVRSAACTGFCHRRTPQVRAVHRKKGLPRRADSIDKSIVHIKSCTAQISKNINFGTLPNFCPGFQRAKVDKDIIEMWLIHTKIIHKSIKYRVNHKIIHIIHRFAVISYVNHTLSSRTFILWIFPSDIMSYPEYRTLRQQ